MMDQAIVRILMVRNISDPLCACGCGDLGSIQSRRDTFSFVIESSHFPGQRVPQVRKYCVGQLTVNTKIRTPAKTTCTRWWRSRGGNPKSSPTTSLMIPYRMGDSSKKDVWKKYLKQLKMVLRAIEQKKYKHELFWKEEPLEVN